MENGADNTDLMFIAGQSEFNDVTKEGSRAIIGCIEMAYHLTLVSQYKLQNPNFTGVSSIKRIRASQNEFLVGVERAIVVVNFDKNKIFSEITTFNDLHTGSQPLNSGLIDDIAVYNDTVLVVSRRDKYVTQIKLNPT